MSNAAPVLGRSMRAFRTMRPEGSSMRRMLPCGMVLPFGISDL